MLRFLVADDHDVVCQGVQHILKQEFPDAFVAQAHNAGEVWQQLRVGRWDAVVLDIGMPGQSGLEILKEIKERWPALPVLMLSAHAEKLYAIRALKIGAAGYLNKESTSRELAGAVRQVLDGGKYLTSALAEQLADYIADGKGKSKDQLAHESLTDREYQVLCLLAQGRKVGEIADSMALSVSAVSTYRARILKKLQVESTAEIVRYAIEHDLRI